MQTKSKMRGFLIDEICILAWNASVQRAHLYDPSVGIDDSRKGRFREAILRFIRNELLASYGRLCPEEEHLHNIERLTAFGGEVGSSVLGEKGYKYGVAQKLLNLLLKYLWCLNEIAEPPHCPVDRIVLGRTELRGKLNWTEIVSREEYMQAIRAIRVVAQKEGKGIADWELHSYERR